VSTKNKRVCPVERAGSLDNRMRKWLQDPQKILGPYITEGMTVLDLGCGPGFFSVEMAQMVGTSGRVIASDLQEGMLDKVRAKIQGTELEPLITLHKCEVDQLGIIERVDFILLFYMVHEVENKKSFFNELRNILNQDGQILIVEPPIHVSKTAFNKSVTIARDTGFIDSKGPRVLFSKTVILKKD